MDIQPQQVVVSEKKIWQSHTVWFCVTLCALIIIPISLLATHHGMKLRQAVAGQTASCSITTTSSPGSPVILNATETASANDVISLQGGNFGSNPEVWIAGSLGTSTINPQVSLPILSKSSTTVLTRMPTNLSQNVISVVWVKNGQNYSNPIYINKPRITGLEFHEVVPGQKIRIWGRNLTATSKIQPFGGGNTITFTDKAAGTPIKAAAAVSDQYSVTAITPQTLVEGHQYDISITNTLSGCFGVGTSPETVLARKYAQPPFGLSVPWALDFSSFITNIFNVKTDTRMTLHATGNGITNDRAAIQEAIDKAFASGGGVVYLPSGIYKIDFTSGNGLVLKSKVVIKGDGMHATTLQFGASPFPVYMEQTPVGYPIFLSDTESRGGKISTSGMTDLFIQYVPSSFALGGVIQNPVGGCQKLFFQNIKADFQNYTDGGLFLRNCKDLSITNSTFTKQGNTPLSIFSTSYLTLLNNIFRYNNSRIGMYGDHITAEKNAITLDASVDKINDGGFDFGGENITFIGNSYQMINLSPNYKDAPDRNTKGDGEAYLAQQCYPNGNSFADMGNVSNATTTSMTDSSKAWKVLGPSNPLMTQIKESISIVSGTGAGQWRSIVSNTPTTVTVDKPWDIIPGIDSHYTITNWSLKNFLMKGNSAQTATSGINIVCGAEDAAIVGNTFTNAEGIWIRANQSLYNTNGTWLGAFDTNIRLLIADNQIIDTQGQFPAPLALMQLQTRAIATDTKTLFGTGFFDAEVRRNKIQVISPQTKHGLMQNGFWNYVQYQELFWGGLPDRANGANILRSTPDNTTQGIVGSIFQDNQYLGSTETTSAMYTIGTGVYQTLFQDNHGTITYRDDVGQDAAHGATGSVLVGQFSPVITPTPSPAPAPCTTGTITTSPMSPATVGTPITITGSASCTGTLLYRFWIQDPNTGWHVVQDYSTKNTYSWTTTGLQKGNWWLEADVKNQGSIADKEAEKTMIFTLQ